MRNIISTFIKYPKVVTLLLLAVGAFGYMGLTSLNSTFFPLEDPRYIYIRTVLPGAAPEEIEESIVLKIEEELKSVTGIERITSSSQENSASINVEIIYGYDPDDLLQEVKNAVNSIPSFPVNMEPAIIYKEEIVQFAYNFAVMGSSDLLELKEEAERIEREILASDGISKVELSGFPDREIEISVKEDMLRSLQVTFEEVGLAVKQANIDLTGGVIKGDDMELSIRSRNKSNDAEVIKETIVKALPDGQKVYLKDIAEVNEKWSDSPNSNYLDGERSVNVTIRSTKDEDILANAEFARNYIKIYNKSNTQFKLKKIRDGSVTLRERIELLTSNGITGTILVFIFLALFLNVRLSFWVALGIPVSFMGMFVIASFVGLTINVLSLFGMIIVVGILVDDGVVISENIYQHYERGKSPLRASIDGIMEVLPSVISAIITTCASFSIFFFIEGRMGDFFSDIAVVVISTLTFSLIEAALFLPAHIASSKGLREERPTMFDRAMEKVEIVMNKVMYVLRNRIYAPILNQTLKTPIIMGIIIPMCFLMVTLSAFKNGIVGFSFFPVIEHDTVIINLELPAGTPSKKTANFLKFMEEKAIEVNESYKKEGVAIDGVTTKVERKLGPSTNAGRIIIGLVPGDERDVRNMEITERIRKAIGEVPEAEKLTFGTASPFGAPIEMSIRSNDLVELEQAKNDVKAAMADIPELVDIYDNDKKGSLEVVVSLKDKARHLGLSLQEVMSQVRQGFFGHEVQRLQRGKDEEKVWIRYKEEDRKTFQQLENMRIRIMDKGEFPLREIVNFRMERSPMVINHIDGQREVRINSDIRSEEVSTGDMIALIEESILIPLMNQYPSISYSFEGQMKTSRKVGRSVARVGPVILIIMFVMIVLTFRSFSQSFIVMPILIPFSLIGVIFGHWLHGHQVSILSMLGIIALIGVLINDSLVFISAFNQKIQRNVPFIQAVYQTGISRFRPIMLTSVTTIAGLSPLIMETSFQARFLIPMAISIAYGLAAATIQTLIMIPAFLIIRNKISIYIIWLWSGNRPSREEVEPAYTEIKHIRELENQ